MRTLRTIVGLALATVLGAVPAIPWTRPVVVSAPWQGVVATPVQHVVVNEVAWGGTAASSADEWIELLNTDNVTHALEGWRLVATDGSPDIPLTGVIGPYDYYLIERTDDGTITNIAADLTASFGTGLSNDGESLLLRNAAGDLVDSVNADGGGWPTGDGGAPDYRSMERRSPVAPDRDISWVSHDGTTGTALDAAGNNINGTPGAINGAYLPLWAAISDVTVAKSGPLVLASGDVATYRLTLANRGGLAATNVALTDTLSSALQFVAQHSDLAFTQTGDNLVWTLAELGPDLARTIVLTAQLTSETSPDGTITNTAGITTTAPDLCAWNNVASWTTPITPAGATATSLLISGVAFDGYQLNDEDEAVELHNIGPTAISLAGWRLCDEEDGQLNCRALPDVIVPAETAIWLAKDVAAFTASFGAPPAAQLASWPRMANTGDEVVLLSPTGDIIDALVYGEGSLPAPHWAGPPLQPYASSNLRGVAGQILARALDEASGLPVADTDTAADWMQYPEDGLLRRRVVYPGWDRAVLHHPLKTTGSTTATLAIAPDNAYEVVANTLQRATGTILIEAYTFRHPELLEILVAKAAQGLTVTVLLEGNPVGLGDLTPEWHQELAACERLEAAGGSCYFMVHEPADYVYNRYEYLHIKMIIVDDRWLVAGSQNLTPTSLPADPKANGTFGSRGAVLVLQEPRAIGRAKEIFALDLDTAHQDILRWNTGYPDRYGTPPAGTALDPAQDVISYTVRFPHPCTITDVTGLELYTGPEATLRRTDALAGLVGRAGPGDTVYIEQQYERLTWGADTVAGQNPRLLDYANAARRGARVRVLLNGKNYVDGASGPDEENMATVRHLNALARAEQLDLWASVGDPTGAGIHNKMALVDLGNGSRYVHLGSLNGSEASNKINREIVVQLRSDQAFSCYAKLFRSDWYRSNPIYMPVVARVYTAPPPPADHVVITEVCYSCAPTAEWVEITNPGPLTLDLTGYKLTDAEAPDAYESAFTFPAGTLLPPAHPIVIAVNGAAVPGSTLELYESDPGIPNMIPYPDWGDLRYPFALRNEGDHVLLLDPANRVVDAVTWGDAMLPGVTAHPGISTVGASLERVPVFQDTDDCAADFHERYPPTPGSLP